MIQQFFFVFSVLFYNRVFRLFQGEDAITTATACNPFMIGSGSNELRHHKFSEDRMTLAVLQTKGCCVGSYHKFHTRVF